MKRLKVTLPIVVSLLTGSISIVLLIRYGNQAGPEVLVVLAIVVPLLLWLFVYMRRQSRALDSAQAFATEFSRPDAESYVVVVMFDQAAARTSRKRTSGPRLPEKAGATVALVERDSLSFFEPQSRTLLAKLVLGVHIHDFSFVFLDQGERRSQPCLQVRFVDGDVIELVVYDATTGLPADKEAFRKLPHFGGDG